MPRTKLFDEKEILNKSIELFWTKGYHPTSIQDLVTHLGINRASIYDTYGGKKELFNKAFYQYRTESIEQVDSFLNSQPNVKEGMRRLFKNAIQESLEDKNKKGCFVVNTTTEMIPGDEEIQAVLDENKRTFESMFYNFLLDGEKRGEFEKGKDLKAISCLFFTLYNGVRVVSKMKSNKKSLLDSVDIAVSLLD